MDSSTSKGMFDKFILKMWKLSHLKTRTWYLECPSTACSTDEAALFAHSDALAINDLLSKGLGELEKDLEIKACPTGASHADVGAPLTPHISGSTSKGSRKELKRSEQTAAKKTDEVEVLLVDGSLKGKGVNWPSLFARVQISQSTTSN